MDKVILVTITTMETMETATMETMETATMEITAMVMATEIMVTSAVYGHDITY